MSLHPISATEALRQLDAFDTVVDARTEDEFKLDHLPHAVNWPTLNNVQRIEVGTLYKANAFEAKKLGASMAASNIAKHIQQHVMDKPRDWKPLTYCWRGGKRSGSLSLILSEIGFKVHIIEGGYKAFRAAVIDDIPRHAERLNFIVICGTTGSGKTRLLHALANLKHSDSAPQVLDLEALANHRSSVLGVLPGLAQPSQKAFDTLVWNTLRQFDPGRPVFVESESKKVGNVAVPESVMQKMRASPCLNLQLPLKERVALLMEDYDFFVNDTAFFCERLEALTAARGREVVKRWQDLARNNHCETVVQELLTLHYDPVYLQSMQRNFLGFANATQITLTQSSPQFLSSVAQGLSTKILD
ncbi:MAG TPA: tRNA 2-selenouridine(34) synthase MnmH [Burkholderiaceae bacterium]|nr:tRNA 2-selenouridine(34) synthase MnmH [Burkholderiaceae bacterium]